MTSFPAPSISLFPETVRAALSASGGGGGGSSSGEGGGGGVLYNILPED